MNATDVILTLIFNGLPIVILIVPLFFIWKTTIGKLYLRIVIGIILFYLLYWILPIIFQLRNDPKQLITNAGEEGLGLIFIAGHFTSLIAFFSSYPIITLPFIFFVTPFISIIIVWNHLRKNEGSIKESLNSLSYDFAQSPIDMIKNGLLNPNWKKQKEILKLMIVLLPISLYLLQVILDITGLQNFSLETAETALGWFIEILFVYIAIFIFSIEILSSSQIALKGRYFGETIRNQTYKSLYTVGAPISLLSIVLFILKYFDSIDIIFFFFVYFIMASIIFILFLDIFEPFSILILIKIIDWWKNKNEKINRIDKTNFYYGLIFSLMAVGIFIILGLSFISIYGEFFSDHSILITESAFNYSSDPSLANSLRFEVMNTFNTITLIIAPLFLSIIGLAYSLKYSKSNVLAIIIVISIIIVTSITFSSINLINDDQSFLPLINFVPEEYWITGQTCYTNIFGFNIYTLRTASFKVDLSGLLFLLATPYSYARYIVSIMFYGFLMFYLKKSFKIKNIPIKEGMFQKTFFSNISSYISYHDYVQQKNLYLITKNELASINTIEQGHQQARDVLPAIENEMLLESLIAARSSEKNMLYLALKFLYESSLITIWKAEFSYTFERVEKQGLYVIYGDGRDIITYEFVENLDQDPALISGMFSAITSFIKETTHTTETLKTIDHGDITIMLEYGSHVFTALFIKGNQTSEIRAQLKKLIYRFEKTYNDILKDWDGDLRPFKDTDQLIEEIFQEE